jgi:hypothetical protein
METEDTLSVLNRILLIATENQKDSPDSIDRRQFKRIAKLTSLTIENLEKQNQM